MRRYLRNREGSVFFFTQVAYQRRRFLTTSLARDCLRQAIAKIRVKRPFDIPAIVLLPDHLHTVWQLPSSDHDYSTRWRLIKSEFTRLWTSRGGVEAEVSSSRQAKSERGVWQRRFYEHTCRDEADLQRCMDYVHVNPLKHGLVERVVDWPWSSFHRYVAQGIYSPEWGAADVWYGDEFLNAE